MYVVQDMLKAYEFFRSKNIKIDLVIFNNEENSYEQYVNYEIENAIANKQMEFLKNQYGGIFVINSNQIEKDDIDLLEFKANVIIDSKLGNIEERNKRSRRRIYKRTKKYRLRFNPRKSI